MAENDFERTEPATQRRREEARQQGNIARSADLTAALTLLAAVLLLHGFGLSMLGHFKTDMHATLAGGDGNPTRPTDIMNGLAYHGYVFISAAGPVVLAIIAVTLVVSFGQVGFLFSTQPIEPNFEKISPLRGLRNLFEARAGARFALSLMKVVVITGITVWVVWDLAPRIAALPGLSVAPAFVSIGEMVYSLAIKIAALLLALAIVDYAFQYWQRERDLRMTKQEVKEELKRMEGDPLIRQRRARVARQLMLQRIGQTVPRADVVVTNPTHFAIALKYDSNKMKAPKVVAKGADFVAMRIRQIAIGAGVPLVERKDLARALYKNVEVNQEVPPQFYTAVAEVLAYVYRLGKRKTA